MSKYFMYGPSDPLNTVKTDIENGQKCYVSLRLCLQDLVDRYGSFDIKDLSIKYYGYDERIDRNVYMVTTKRIGRTDCIKEYGAPQFVQFLVELNEEAINPAIKRYEPITS